MTSNPYPVKVNGNETAIEGYNINDNTYFKLRDVADAVGGFTVGFSDNTITIDTPTVYPKPTDAPTVISENAELNPDGTRKYTVDGLLIEYHDDIGYVYTSDIEKLYSLVLIGDNYIVDKSMKKIEISIPTHPDYSALIPIDFYENTLIQFISNITE